MGKSNHVFQEAASQKTEKENVPATRSRGMQKKRLQTRATTGRVPAKPTDLTG